MKKLIKRMLSVAIAAALCLTQCLSARANSFVMTYSFAGTPYIYQNNVAAAEGVLDTLSPSAFDAGVNGTVIIHTITHAFVEEMHKKGLTVTPFYSNHWDRELGIAALENMDAVTDTLANAVIEYGLDGINVDIENVNEKYRDQYTAFVRLLREKLPSHIVSVAVAANPNNWTAGWHGSYDYTALARYCDYLLLMAYDESYEGSKPGAVASFNFIERSILYAIQRVTADKLVLGVPLYGRYWKTGDSVGGYGITMNDVETLIGLYPNATIRYDSTAHANEVTVNVTADFKLWGGRTMSAGNYTIWYDNLESLRKKVNLVNAYGLKGLGSWALGQESTDFWQMCGETLKNLIFSDITGHWAEQSILYCYEQGWMLGDKGRFRPGASMTRAEAAAVMVRVMGLEDSEPGKDFADTANHWAREYIAIARANNLMSGVGGNRFSPNAPITREQIAVLIDNAAVFSNAVDYHDIPFSDIGPESSSWSYEAIIKMYHNGILAGYPDGTFRPKANVKRAEMARILENLSGFGMNAGDGPYTPAYDEYGADGYNEHAISPR